MGIELLAEVGKEYISLIPTVTLIGSVWAFYNKMSTIENRHYQEMKEINLRYIELRENLGKQILELREDFLELKWKDSVHKK